ncbi:MAG TPA: TadE family protein [Candidatus Dormibacteraeota bacterium]|nr:TadE family protein [Candidatus Dormibacteraeota bacterium]
MEFALVAPIFLMTMFGLVNAVWFVFETQAVTYASRAAARWAVAQANYDPTTGTVPCTAGGATPAPPGMLQAAQAAAGPFAGAITTSTLTTDLPSDPAYGLGCQVTVKLPFSFFGGIFHIGPTRVTSVATDYVT